MERRGYPSPRGEGDSRLQARAGWGGSPMLLAARHRGSGPPGQALTRPSPPSPRGEGSRSALARARLAGREEGLRQTLGLGRVQSLPQIVLDLAIVGTLIIQA